jgi:DNA-binding cell septation regulator SpoVG
MRNTSSRCETSSVRRSQESSRNTRPPLGGGGAANPRADASEVKSHDDVPPASTSASPPLVTQVAFTKATDADQRRDILGYVRFVVAGQLALDGIAVRRARGGRVFLAFPVRHDRTGRQHPLMRPIGDAARRDLEAQVLAALAHQLDSAP